MIEQQAQVTSVDSDLATIEVVSKPGCQGCQSRQSCGISALGRLFGSPKTKFTIDNDHHLNKGDWIVVGLPEQAYLKAGFLVYLMPLLCMFAIVLLVQSWSQNEGLQVIAAIAGLLAGLKLANWWSSRRYRDQFTVSFVRREFIGKTPI